MKIITSADNKKTIATHFGCSLEAVRSSLSFRTKSTLSLEIRNFAMNNLRSFFI